MTYETPEQRSERGRPMTAATPRDLIHVRLGSFVIFLAFAVGVLSLIMGLTVVTIVAAVVAVAAVVDVVLAVRRQRRLGTGPQSTG
ncbi:hypothetical protein Sru01_16100 [Sphaerisporangium rufum]|uniref:Uncharacterized protein n=1 Tax=Sphaerisporangium rufum TaxID=1381558 RepID=A0A919R0B0_9ACTN|nr:hypothetical protein [Sphaerisporangium rufum]GII76628.1 hypothetical protein Sru01_16100 [Sphaerisporangium rufum]